MRGQCQTQKRLSKCFWAFLFFTQGGFRPLENKQLEHRPWRQSWGTVVRVEEAGPVRVTCIRFEGEDGEEGAEGEKQTFRQN